MRLSDVHVGDTVIIDDGFDCMAAGPRRVEEDADGFYVSCSYGVGRHYLDGQEDELGELVGVSAPVNE